MTKKSPSSNQGDRAQRQRQTRQHSITGGRWRSGPRLTLRQRQRQAQKIADHIDGYDHDDLGESPDY